MRAVSMDIHIEYLLSYIQDELKDLEGLRIHPIAPTGTKKSVDLPQDYNPEECNLHQTRGVRVRAGSREYFFPAEWAASNDFTPVQNQAREIRDFYLSYKTEKLT